jgi:quercetin dioxygenase-like cupin family protein
MLIRLSLVAAGILAVAPVALAQRAPDAVAVDPTHHNVVFENDHVRVFRAMGAPGARSPMHSHPPFVFVGLETTRLRLTPAGASPMIFDIHPEQVLWMVDAEHSWEMVAGHAHVIGVEIKAAARGTPPRAITLPATDAATVDPTLHQIILENEYVRVIEALASPGYRSPMHSHSYGLAVISLGRPRLRITLPDGNSMITDLHPGQVLWLDAGSHSWEVLAGQHRVIAVEVKSATAP